MCSLNSYVLFALYDSLIHCEWGQAFMISCPFPGGGQINKPASPKRDALTGRRAALVLAVGASSSFS